MKRTITDQQVCKIIDDSILRLKLRKQGRNIWSLYPELRAATERLACYSLDFIHLEDKSLLIDCCIQDACNAYLKIDVLPHEPEQSNALREAYMMGLLSRVVRLTEVKVYAREGSATEVWDPLAEPLTRFLNRNESLKCGVVEEKFDSINPEHFRLAIASRIFSVANLACMRPVFDRIGVGVHVEAA